MRERGATFRRVLANPDLRRLQLALVGSEIGYWGFTVAFAVWAFAEGGAALVGVAAFVRLIPGALAGPIGGALADRHSRRQVMVVSDLLRSLTLAIGAGAMIAGLPLVVLAAVGLNSAVSTAFRPAMSALLPELTRTPEELTAANVVAGAVDSSAIFVGPALGGLLLVGTSPEAVLGVAAVATTLSAALVARVSSERPRPRPEGEEHFNMARAIVEGMQAVRAERGARVLLIALAGQTFVWGLITVLMVVVALETLARDESWVGYLSAAVGVGGLAGTAAAAGLVGRRRLGTALAVSLAASSAPLAAIGFAPEAVVALAALGAVGLAMTVMEVASMTLLQRIVPEAVLARVFGLTETIIFGSIAIGALVAPVVVEVAGDRAALLVAGLLLPALTLVSWPALAALDHLATVRGADVLGLLRRHTIFSELPPPALERLAAAAVPAQFAAGAPVFAQGDPGDRYYLIAGGEVDVSVDGQSVGTLGPGEGFGEIALLNDSPRTASVRALGDLALQSLGREEFLAVVSGHAASARAAAGVVGARLASSAPSPGVR